MKVQRIVKTAIFSAMTVVVLANCGRSARLQIQGVPFDSVDSSEGERLAVSTCGSFTKLARLSRVLRQGQAVRSCQNGYRLLMQHDGNLVLLNAGNAPLWSACTNHGNVKNLGNRPGPNVAAFQADGNLVIYDGEGHPLNASNTVNRDVKVLVLQDDGNLVMYDTRNRPVWATNTAGGVVSRNFCTGQIF